MEFNSLKSNVPALKRILEVLDRAIMVTVRSQIAQRDDFSAEPLNAKGLNNLPSKNGTYI